MSKNKSPTLATRAWRLLHLALLCKTRLVNHIHLALTSLKCLCNDHRQHSYRLGYGEHELSFDDTPTFRFIVKRRGRRSFLSCIDPPLVSFDDEDEDDKDEEECIAMDEGGCRTVEGEESVDAKAEEFISRFYEEMKLQRQLSYLKYKKMIRRGTS